MFYCCISKLDLLLLKDPNYQMRNSSDISIYNLKCLAFVSMRVHIMSESRLLSLPVFTIK